MMEPHRQALNFYKHASELPPLDVESRTIIAKAHNRLAFTRAHLGLAKRGAVDGSDRALILQAESDYQRSIDLFEQLHNEFPADLRVRRYYAEALGSWGWGWYLAITGRLDEAKPHYQQAVGLLREQIHDVHAGTGANGDARVQEGVANVLGDLGTLASTVHGLSLLLENLGQLKEAGEVKKQLDEDVSMLAVRFSEPARRKFWADQFFVGGRQSLHQQNRLSAALDFRLVTLLMPDHAEAHNSLAWAMTSVRSSTTPFAISVALDSARKAVELKPREWMYWNTLGVVAFRAQDWNLAAESLERSIELHRPGGAIDFFFLAMTRKHQGQQAEAEKLFKKGEAYLNHNPGDPELAAFRHEAFDVLHSPAIKSELKRKQENEDKVESAPPYRAESLGGRQLPSLGEKSRRDNSTW